MQRVPVLAAEEQLGVDPVLDHRRRAPLAGDQRVLIEVPPGVVGQVLRSAVGLPGAQHVEGVVVEQGDAARALVGVPGAEAGHEDPVRAAVQGVRAGIARRLGQLGRADRPDQLGLPRVRVGVVDVDVGGPQPGQQQVAALQPVGVVPGVRERAAARVPPEVVQLVSAGRQVGPADDLSVPGRRRVGVEHGERVGLLRRPVEGDHVGQLLGRRADRFGRTAVEGWVDVVTCGMTHLFSSSRFP